MAFMKILKTAAFFKRYQVPKRRRYQGKTDYAARRVMIHQDKNKYNSKKYRMVVRFSNTKVVCQVVYATIRGDRTISQANSPELVNFGIPCGYKNYAAAYATGLLLARRTLKKFGMDEDFKGKEEVDGEEYHVEEEETEVERRPFKCILDVGIKRTCEGARMWGALKGAVDGGLHIPHKCKNFPGYTAPEDKSGEPQYDAEAHKAKIFGEHVKDYMESMAEEDPTKYEAHFSKFIAASISADNMEEMYTEAHSKIRADPTGAPKDKKSISWTRDGDEVTSEGKTVTRSKKIGLEARRAKVLARISAAQESMMDQDDD